MEQITFFDCLISRRNYGFYIFKVHQGGDKWNSNWMKDTEEENHKMILFLCEKHEEDKFTKSLYERITSLFPQKSLKVYRNSGR